MSRLVKNSALKSKNNVLSLAMLEKKMFTHVQHLSQTLEEELVKVKMRLNNVKNDENQIIKLEKLQTNCLETQRVLNLSNMNVTNKF